MDSDWLTGLLVVLMVTIAVGLLWSGTMFGSGHTPAPIIIETPAPAVEAKDSKKKPRQRTNAQQSPKATVADVTDTKEAPGLATSSSSQDFGENNPSRSPKKKKNKVAKRDEVSEHTDNVTEEATANDGAWQTQLSRQQKQELLRQRRQQESATQLSNESASPPEESIEKQIASAADEVVTTSITDSKDDKLMYLESNDDDADAWLVITNENSST